MRKTSRLSLLLGLLTCLPLAVWSQGSFPTKPIQVVIPFPPGGATDVLGRLVSKKLGEKLGQSIVIENKAGAGTIIGASYVAKSAPDGYTLLMSSGTTFTVNPAIHARLPYDPVKSFEPVGMIGRTGLILLAHKDAPANDVKQFVALVKAAPGKYSYGSFGTGTTSQFAGEMFFYAAGLKMVHVPYKGSSPAMIDLMGGQIPFTVDTVAAALPQLRDGKIKAIAVTSGKRTSFLPNVPTLAESGYPDINMDTWLALVGPRGLPSAVRSKLEKALAESLADPETRDKIKAAGFEPQFIPGASVSELIDKELPLMRATALRARIQAD